MLKVRNLPVALADCVPDGPPETIQEALNPPAFGAPPAMSKVNVAVKGELVDQISDLFRHD